MFARTPHLGFAALLVAIAAAAHAAPVNVTVDTSLDRHPINPLIYGVNFGDTQEFTDVPYPLRRWGGNSTTRYNWQLDTHNTASDWFFQNIPSSIANPAALPDGSDADLFVTETRGAHAEVLMTVPTIGWTPKSRAKTWGFSVAKYGAQQQTECTATGGAFWCTADAGNGVASGGGDITGNDPADTSIPATPAFEQAWIAHLVSRFGNAAAGGVRYYALDNEPALWNSTHRDVHPNPLTYDELWTRTSDYATAVKAADPLAQVTGPASWGWCEYFYSAADGCGPGADRAAHGGLGLTEWYLKQVNDHLLATGQRLVDVLDVHYYPQDGSALNDNEDATTSARRLRELKSLYDPTYVDESWIGQPVQLIPRMKALIAARCPGIGLAITEYNFGGDTGISSAIAQAEALAIFGREGVTMATRWVAPAHGTLVQDAFRLYLDYDGAGAKVTGQGVRATSSAVDRVGAYAIDDRTGGKLHVLLFNKSTVSETVHLTTADGLGGAITLRRFAAGSPLAAAGGATMTSGAVDLVLPARSATLAIVSRPVSGVEPPVVAPGAGFALHAHPNPFAATTSFAFTLPAAGLARVTIYDAAGRRVRQLVDGDRPAGANDVAWDGTDDAGRPVPAGMFMCQIRANGHAETRWLVRTR